MENKSANKILFGKPVAEKIEKDVSKIDKTLVNSPTLVTIRIGNDKGSIAYENAIKKTIKKFSIRIKNVVLSSKLSEIEIITEIKKINQNKKHTGIILLKPLPKKFNNKKFSNIIDVKKDIDGITNIAIADLLIEKNINSHTPATAEAVIKLLDFYKIDIASKNIVVLGRSNVIGKPVALLLTNSDATVTICHSKTKDLVKITGQADILISAIGKPKFITKDFIKKNAVIIDIGTSVVNGKLMGDVDFEDVFQKALKITPVPGGIGSITNMILIKHLFLIALDNE